MDLTTTSFNTSSHKQAAHATTNSNKGKQQSKKDANKRNREQRVPTTSAQVTKA